MGLSSLLLTILALGAVAASESTTTFGEPPPLYGGLEPQFCPPPKLYEFFSRPDLKAPVFTVENNTDPAPGYIFLTPYGFFRGMPNRRQFDFGPHIYDNDGELVWSGAALQNNTPYGGSFNFHACQFEGQTHLCFAHLEEPISVNDILNSSYERVRSLVVTNRTNGDSVQPDTHEFNIVHPSSVTGDDEMTEHSSLQSAIVTAWVTKSHNATLLECAGQPNVSWVKSILFQEISLDGSDTVLFEWDALDHIPVPETMVCPGEEPGITGMGKEEGDAFDFMHANSIDKDSDDNYIVSGRHASTIYKVDGRTGEVIWRLGGRNSSFVHESDVEGAALRFDYQHHIRFDNLIPGADGVSKFGVTLWDNGSTMKDFANKKTNVSSALSILIDEENMVAWLKDRWVSPEHQLDSNQGSHQVLPNRNHLFGMGNVPYVVEYDLDHNLVFYGHLGETNIHSYRSFRYEWEGRPTDNPSLFAYAPSCHGDVRFYVSWNGATEVKYWSFFVGSSPDDSGMREVVSTVKSGFETVARGGAGTHAYAIAYDENREPLGRSDTIEVFIPAYEIYNVCFEENCGFGFNYTDAPRKSCLSETFPDEHQIFLDHGRHSTTATAKQAKPTAKQASLIHQPPKPLELEPDSPIRLWWR